MFLNQINPTPSPGSLELIATHEKNLGTDVVKKAINITSDERKSFGYLKAILQRCQTEGIDSLVKWEAQERDWKKKKAPQRSSEAEPDYMATLTDEDRAFWRDEP